MLNNNLVRDLLTTAIEGGSNYWYFLPNEEEWKDYKKPHVPTINAIHNAIFDGKTITVIDVENKEDLGVISLENIQRADELLQEKFPNIMQSIIDEQFDANDADIWLQFVVMKNIVYG